MTTTRLFPANGGTISSNVHRIRRCLRYEGFVDVVGDPDTGDAATIKSEGWVVAGTSGPTATRPPNQHPGSWHVDTTLGYSVVWDGGFWRNPITGASV